ncbi:MAG: SDR family oxidoreductase [Hyphomicrobiaceae bacterium]
MNGARQHLLCFGLGYCAKALVARLKPRGWRISGTSRTVGSAAKLQDLGVGAIVFDSGEATAPSLPTTVTHALISVPPGAQGDPVLRAFCDQLAAMEQLRWIGYLSTVGVYGDHGGAWVHEETPPAPVSERGQRRLAAESAWLDFAENSAKQAQIFRLPGIYGPGRNALESLRQGKARRIVKPGQVFNRIHVVDIAATLEAAMAKSVGETIFNVTDDEPAPPQDVVTLAAELLGLEPPLVQNFDAAELSPMARSFYDENKRVENKRIKQVLGVKLAYPTYREGLRALVHDLTAEG